MGFLDIFKSGDDSPAKETYRKAKSLFSNKEYPKSLQLITLGFKEDIQYAPLFALAAENLTWQYAEDESKLFQDVANNVRNAYAIYRLGEYFFNREMYDTAALFFERTMQLSRGHESAPHDLAICYARTFQVAKAIEVLRAKNKPDFWDLYFLYKCRILNKDLEGMQQQISHLTDSLDKHGPEVDFSAPKRVMVQLQEILDRYNSMNDIRTHIRDWHYIQYGGIVLQFFDDTEQYVAGGRHVATWGSNGQIKAMVQSLHKMLDKLSVSFTEVAALPDRDSEIIGRLCANELGLPFRVHNESSSTENCLVVTSSTNQLSGREELDFVAKGQMIFSANHSWLESAPISPDIIGLMAQTYKFPWESSFKVNPDSDNHVEKTPPDDRDPKVIADEIFNGECDSTEDAGLQDFYVGHKKYLVLPENYIGKQRYNFVIESPIGGSRFN